MAERLFFRPADGWAGDFIPYCDGQRFRLLYLKTVRPKEMFSDIGWHCVTTRDCVHFEDERDLGIHGGTGSVVHADGAYHLFFCNNDDPDAQYICHAVGQDLVHWTVLEEDAFTSSGAIYERRNFRDPHVFWHEQAGEYRMLVATRTVGPTNRAGCTGLLSSKDLRHWTELPPLYAPATDVGAHECPDIFNIGEWWYLTYSTYTGFYATVYRMSHSPDGPWTAPLNESLDGRAFYAGKTASLDGLTYLFGWNPSKEGVYYPDWNPRNCVGKDANVFDWGGNLVVHRLAQRADGTLYCVCPDALRDVFRGQCALAPQPLLGDWHIGDEYVSLTDDYNMLSVCDMPTCGRFSFTLCFTKAMRRCGVALHSDENADLAYYLTFDRQFARVDFSGPMRQKEDGWRVIPYMVELEQPLPLLPEVDYQVEIIFEDSIVVVYVEGHTALSARMYDKTNGKIALFALGAGTRFSNAHCRVLDDKGE